MNFNDFINLELFNFSSNQEVVSFTVFHALMVIVVILVARLLTWALSRIFNRAIQRGTIAQGPGYAIRQILRYFIWVITIVYVLDFIGAPITVLLAGSTALFVGLGLGLQDSFKDVVSGIILLTERTVNAGDVIETDQMVGRVAEVGLRTTKVWTRDQILKIIPNSRLTSQGFVNWTHQRSSSRFHVDVGVIYGSDSRLVEKLLLDVMKANKDLDTSPKPMVQFIDFGDSAMKFRAHFYTKDMFRIEFIKSDLRHAIGAAFDEAGVKIAFPQMDVWLRNP